MKDISHCSKTAPIVKYQHLDNITALFFIVNVSDIIILLFFVVDAFHEQ